MGKFLYSMFPKIHEHHALFWSGITLLAAILNLTVDLPWIQCVSGMGLMLWFPGHGLARRLLAGGSADFYVKLCFSFGLSLWLSCMVMLGLIYSGFYPSATILVGALTLLSLGLYLISPVETLPNNWQSNWWAPVLLIVAAAALRLPDLGYSEFQGDEADNVLFYCLQLLNGDSSALYSNRRPPAQLLISAMGFLLGGNFDEFSIRLPFCIAGIGIVLAIFLVGRQLFGELEGVVAGLFVAACGYCVAFSRLLQYQTIVVLSVCLMGFCIARFLSNETRRPLQWIVLAFLFLGFATFSHYEGFIALPMLIYGLLSFRRHNRDVKIRPAIVTGTAIFLLICGSFYVPYILGPQLKTVVPFYAKTRFGEGWLHFNWHVFLNSAVPYNSLPLLGAAGGLTLLSLAFWYQRGCRLLWIWFGSYFLVFMVLMRVPNTHIHNFFYPWFLLSAVGFAGLFRRLEETSSTTLTAVFRWVSVSLFLACFGYVSWFVNNRYLQHHPERIWQMAESERPQYGIFGLPYHRGWKTVGYLFRSRQLSGSYISNEKPDITNFYLRQSQQKNWQEAKFIIYANNPQTWKHNRFQLAKKHYQEVVRVVNGEGKLKIAVFQRDAKAAEVRLIDFHAFEKEYHLLDANRPSLIAGG